MALIIFLVVSSVLFIKDKLSGDHKTSEANEAPSVAENPPAVHQPPPVSPPPSLPGNARAQIEAAQNPDMLATEETLDDEQIEQEQVNGALAQLASHDTAQRVEGAEQLGAYPTKESESALLQALQSDPEAEVRSAAAQSLGYVEKPSDQTLNGLLGAIEDQNEDVRLNAVSTLEDFLLGSEENSKRYKKILGGLKAKADSRTVPQDTRDAIRDIVQDLTSSPSQ